MNSFHVGNDQVNEKFKKQIPTIKLDFSIKNNKTIFYCNKLKDHEYTPVIDVIKDDIGYVIAFYSNIFDKKDRVRSVKSDNISDALINLRKDWYDITNEHIVFKLNLPLFYENDMYYTKYKDNFNKTINFTSDLSIMINVSEVDLDNKRNLFISWQEGTCTIEKNCLVDDNVSEIISELYSFSKMNINDIFNFVILNKS